MFHWPIRLRNAAFVSWFLPACAACVPIQPSDECTDAPIITDGRYIGSTMEAAGDEFGGCGSFPDPDVWYRYVAPYDGRLSANLSSDSQGDYVLGIWNACPFDDGVELDCNAGAGEIGMPAIEVAISAAQQFWIQVAGHPAREGTFTLTVTSSATAAPSGPDVVPSDITETLAFRPEDGTRAYITDTHTCNVGATDLTWGDTSPLMTWNAYRLAEGRLVQIGNSWVKHGFHANASDGCGVACRGGGGDILEAGCRDVYSADFNSNQNEMGPRSAVNAFSGDYSGPRGDCQIDVSICRYLQIAEADLDAGQYPGALYFFEIVLVASEDAAAGNAANNASHRRVTLDENFLFTPAGPMTVGRPALY
ncbi:MAG TPA: hypothetical protein VNT79_00920, partial [Phycisphaerae bacterium]|nr:hypothetical protein [Phycisphaerae bacterium]